MDGLPLLIVDVHAASGNNLLQDGIPDATAIVAVGLRIVATVADLQGLVFEVWLFVEELCFEEVVQVIRLVSFQLERVGCPRTAPTATHGEVALL